MKFAICSFVLILSTSAFAQSASEGETSTCPATLSSAEEPIENSALWTSSWPEGRVVFEPGGPGFIEDDGSLGMKWPWARRIQGQLAVGGRRLDDDAPPARAYIPYGYGDIGFQATYLIFPTPGCWEITGGVSGRSLTFIVLVEKVGDGPEWRRTGPAPGRRVTTDWRDPGETTAALGR